MTNLNLTAMYCVNDSSHPVFRETCGAGCAECDGLVGIKNVSEAEYRLLPSYGELRQKQHRRKQKANNEIEIIMTNPNEPPIIKLNGQAIEGVVELQYNYVTKDEASTGHHNFAVTYLDREMNTVRTVAVNKVWEG